MSRNPLSNLGRMSYGVHLLCYPSALAAYLLVVKPIMKRRAEEAEQREWDGMPKLKPVDPDLFNPFSPIPYHNSVEVKYAFAGINLHNFMNKNHINTQTYPWKGYHNSYDHNDQGEYVYNWTSMHKPRD